MVIFQNLCYDVKVKRYFEAYRVGGEDGNSEKLFEIEEEQDVKVTMRVWMEGTDEDCTNSNELDELIGNIQFISSEVKGGR